jgi:hypothetical protein
LSTRVPLDQMPIIIETPMMGLYQAATVPTSTPWKRIR